MKQITKIKEPKSFIEHRLKRHSTFDNIPKDVKEQLRQGLLFEQGFICCYCMKRIPENNFQNLKIEHFLCQSLNSNLQLSYVNLFASCTGGDGQPKIKHTCDTKKGNSDLSFNPVSTQFNCENLFKFNADGEISSIDNNNFINWEINNVLNLNMQTLKDYRREIYLEVQRNIESESKKLNNKQLKLNYFVREKEKWLLRVDSKFKPFCMVAVYYLNKKIRQYSI